MQSCGTEPLTCGIWCYLHADSVGIELNFQTSSYCPTFACNCGGKISMGWWPDTSEVKCFVWRVKKIHRKTKPRQEELGFSLHRNEKTVFSLQKSTARIRMPGFKTGLAWPQKWAVFALSIWFPWALAPCPLSRGNTPVTSQILFTVMITEIMDVKTPKCHTISGFGKRNVTITYNKSHLLSTYHVL